MKKIIFLTIMILFLLCGCTAQIENSERTLQPFEANVIVDGGSMQGKICCLSDNNISLTVSKPEELSKIKFSRDILGINISFDEVMISEYQSELIGARDMPVAELFEILSTLGKDSFFINSDGEYTDESVYGRFKCVFDLESGALRSAETDRHTFVFVDN